MKKTIPYLLAVILFGVALAMQICYDRANPSLPPTYYDGIYVDLMAQAEYDAWRESKAPSESLYVLKVDQETCLPVCMKIEQGGQTIVGTSFLHDGIRHDLRFINDVLVGARKSCLEEERAAPAAWLGASWETDPEVLKPILDDYAAQVQALSDAAHLAETGSKKE